MIIGILLIIGISILGIVLLNLIDDIEELKKRYNKLVQHNAKLTKEVKR